MDSSWIDAHDLNHSNGWLGHDGKVYHVRQSLAKGLMYTSIMEPAMPAGSMSVGAASVA